MGEMNNKLKGAQHLYPDVIYRFNNLFKTVWRLHNMGRSTEDKSEKDVFVIPVFFSKNSRTFHWIGLDSIMWDWNNADCKNRLLGLLETLRVWRFDDSIPHGDFEYLGNSPPNRVEREDLWTQFKRDQPERSDSRKSIKVIEDAMNRVSRTDIKNWDEIHRAILLLYSGVHHDAERHIEGVFYKILKSCTSHGTKGRFDWLEGELGDTAPFKWIKLKEPCKELMNKCGDQCNKEKWEEKQDVISGSYSKVSLIFLEYLLLNNNSKERDSFGARLNLSRHVAILPIYDQWIGDRGYGGIKGLFITFFDSDASRSSWLEKKRSTLQDVFPELANKVSESAKAIATSLPIEPPYDLVRHFLRVLIYIQDWESAEVFNGGKCQYKFERVAGQVEPIKFGWQEVADAKLTAQATDETTSFDMWWTAGASNKPNFWSTDFIPGLGDEEINRFGNVSIRFKFPKATHIPAEFGDRALLCQEYLRQQLDLMGTLIPKVRARRSALRNAAVSIMARNMSHNIGSHVLAAVRGDRNLYREEENKKKQIHRLKDSLNQLNRLNEHLQRRMDFIAELATVEVLSAADNLFFQEVLGLSKNSTIVNGQVSDGEGRGLNEQTLLLRHISGMQTRSNEAIPAIVKVIDDGVAVTADIDANISFNSGVLGWQALYVILENVIRNIAKHGNDENAQERGEVEVFLKVLDRDSDFFELRIWDNCKKAQKGLRDDPDTPVINYLEKVLEQPNLLNDENAVATKDWGMKEMYISAAFLRGIALSDMEERIIGQPAIIQAFAMNSIGNTADDICRVSSLQNLASFDNLGFSCWLPKAKNVAIIVDDIEAWWKSIGTSNAHELELSLGLAEKRLKAQGVDLVSYDSCIKGTRISHRFGVWLSSYEVPRNKRAELPLDLLNDGEWCQKTGIDRLKSGQVTQFIEDIRNRVLDKRVARLEQSEKSILYFYGSIGNITFAQHLDQCNEIDLPRTLIFDNHGEGIDNQLKDRWITNDLLPLPVPPRELVDKLAFYESRRSQFPQSGLFSSLISRFTETGFEKEALCAALTSVVILDERFQRIAARPASSACKEQIPTQWKSDYQDQFRMGDIWRRMRVYVPLAGDCNLEQPKLACILNYLNDLGAKLREGTFVVVHQSILERLGSEEKGLTDDYLVKKATQRSWVNVVCSGRGVPWQLKGKNHDVAYDPRFIALSALLQCLEHMPSKIHLIRLLEVTRAPSRS